MQTIISHVLKNDHTQQLAVCVTQQCVFEGASRWKKTQFYVANEILPWATANIPAPRLIASLYDAKPSALLVSIDGVGKNATVNGTAAIETILSLAAAQFLPLMIITTCKELEYIGTRIGQVKAFRVSGSNTAVIVKRTAGLLIPVRDLPCNAIADKIQTCEEYDPLQPQFMPDTSIVKIMAPELPHTHTFTTFQDLIENSTLAAAVPMFCVHGEQEKLGAHLLYNCILNHLGPNYTQHFISDDVALFGRTLYTGKDRGYTINVGLGYAYLGRIFQSFEATVFGYSIMDKFVIKIFPFVTDVNSMNVANRMPAAAIVISLFDAFCTGIHYTTLDAGPTSSTITINMEMLVLKITQLLGHCVARPENIRLTSDTTDRAWHFAGIEIINRLGGVSQICRLHVQLSKLQAQQNTLTLSSYDVPRRYEADHICFQYDQRGLLSRTLVSHIILQHTTNVR